MMTITLISFLYTWNAPNQVIIWNSALQVEDAHKSQLLESELKKISKQSREATAIEGEETAKCKAAEEVIKSLTTQVVFHFS